MDIEKIKSIFNRYNGMMKAGELLTERIYYKDIQILLDKAYIEKIRYGYYQWICDEEVSEVKTVSQLFPDGIFCMQTALFYYRYSDRVPLSWEIAVSKDSGKSRFKIEYPFVKPYYVEPGILNIGLAEGNMDGLSIRIYDKERVICDCIRYVNKMDREIFNKAIQAYVNDSRKNIPNLMAYAKSLRVTSRVKSMIGVWL